MKNDNDINIINREVVLVGGGVAGLTALLYLLRAGYRPLLITNDELGGNLTTIDRIQNFVGVFDSSGQDIADNIREQIEQAYDGISYLEDTIVTDVVIDDGKFIIEADNGIKPLKIKADKLIVSTGTKNKTLPEIPSKFQSSCVLCDGFFHKDKSVLVIGGGNSALTEAIELSKIASSVTVLYRSTIRAEQILVERAKSIDNIMFFKGIATEHLGMTGKDEHIVLVEYDEDKTACEFSGIFTYIGTTPNVEFLHKLPIMYDTDGYITTDGYKAVDNDNSVIKNLYAIGDVRSGNVRQFSTAIGDGAELAVEIINDLK